MKNIREILSGLTYGQIKTLFAKHLLWSKENNRIAGKPEWFNQPGTLNIIGIRCNREPDFNFGKYNDFLILILNKTNESYDQVIIPVTVDPNRTKEGIAHLRQGVWNSYLIRPHRWAKRTIPGIGTIDRWAICQDKNLVEIVRTNGKGSVIKSVRGNFGINIHDSGGYTDSSLGCTVIQSDNHYLNLFLPKVYDLKAKKKVPVNHDNLTYCLINHSQLEAYLKDTIKKEERAEAVNPESPQNIAIAKEATVISS